MENFFSLCPYIFSYFISRKYYLFILKRKCLLFPGDFFSLSYYSLAISNSKYIIPLSLKYKFDYLLSQRKNIKLFDNESIIMLKYKSKPFVIRYKISIMRILRYDTTYQAIVCIVFLSLVHTICLVCIFFANADRRIYHNVKKRIH